MLVFLSLILLFKHSIFYIYCVVLYHFSHCLTLCDPMDCSPPGSSVHEILQARILEWVACPPPGDLPNPGIEPSSLALQVDFLLLSHQGSPLYIWHHQNLQHLNNKISLVSEDIILAQLYRICEVDDGKQKTGMISLLIPWLCSPKLMVLDIVNRE